jgi:hypothetical protein
MEIMIGWIQSEFNYRLILLFLIYINFLFENSAGRRTVKSLNRRPNASKSARLLIIPRAGHQMMIDNPHAFHDAIQEALKDHKE